MKSRVSCFAVLGAAVLWSAPAVLFAQVKQSGSNEAMGQKLMQLGSREPDAKTASDVRESLARIINLSVTVGKFPDLVGQLAQADRDRVGSMPREDYDHLNKAITQLRQDFQDKYHQELALSANMLTGAQMILGAGDKSLTVSLSELEKTPLARPGGAEPATHPAQAPEGTIPQKTGLPVVSGPTVHMVNEAGTAAGQASAWKVDIPDELTGSQLKETLTKQLEKIDGQKAAWSDDPRVTSHAIATAVLQALTDASIAVDK